MVSNGSFAKIFERYDPNRVLIRIQSYSSNRKNGTYKSVSVVRIICIGRNEGFTGIKKKKSL